MPLIAVGYKLVICAALLIWSLLQPLSAYASDALIVAYDPDFKPLTFQNEQGAADGVLVDILRGVLKHGDIKFRLVPMPWKRLVAETDAGNIDISLPWRHKDERFDSYNMVGPITSDGLPTRFWQKAADNRTWSSYDDLSGLKVGIRAGYAYAPDFETAPNVERVQTFSIEEMIRMLINGRFEVAISDEVTLRYAARSLGLESKIKPVDGPPVDYTVRYFVVPKSKPDLANRLEYLLGTYKTSQQYAALLSDHLN